MKRFYTRHQVARGSKPDAVSHGRMYLIKNVRKLRATYQVRLLAFEATNTNQKLVLKVPKGCIFDSSLKDLIDWMPSTIIREPL